MAWGPPPLPAEARREPVPPPSVQWARLLAEAGPRALPRFRVLLFYGSLGPRTHPCVRVRPDGSCAGCFSWPPCRSRPFALHAWLTWPDVAALRARTRQRPPSSSAVRARERAAGRRGEAGPRFVAYGRISNELKLRGRGGRGHRLLLASRLRHDRDEARAGEGLGGEEAPRGASTITQQLAKNLWLSPTPQSPAQAQGGRAHAPARAPPPEAPHPRALSQRWSSSGPGSGLRERRPALLREAGVEPGRARGGPSSRPPCRALDLAPGPAAAATPATSSASSPACAAPPGFRREL